MTNIKLFTDNTEPLEEYTISGSGKTKTLIIPINGVISSEGEESLFGKSPSMVQETVSQLEKAAADPSIKAVILKVNSPGGSVTASDVLYHEIMKYKEVSGAKVVAAMMDVAASGGYYISMPADRIVAHPTTLTGSIGVIFMRPNFAEGMDKIGVAMLVSKSGKNKDMGNPFRTNTDDEDKLFQDLTDDMGERFISLVQKHRNPSKDAMEDIATARVMLADDAKELGLVDVVGYLDSAVEIARAISGQDKDSKLVVYRRSEYMDDNLYNSAINQAPGKTPALISSPLDEPLSAFKAGLYYLWMPR
jgi:protease-4